VAGHFHSVLFLALRALPAPGFALRFGAVWSSTPPAEAEEPIGLPVSFLFLVGHFLVLIFVAFLVYLGKFEWFGGDNFKFGTALIADHDVPFFNFVGIEIENALAFLTNWHTTLLSRSTKMLILTAR
jgi:hypothetical protein